MTRGGVLVLVLVLGNAWTQPAAAQQPAVRGYALNVAELTAAGPFGPGGLTDLQRARLMMTPRAGPVRLDLAYEHTVHYQAREGSDVAALTLGAPAVLGDWLPLDGTIHRDAHVRWRHRLDRLSAQAERGSVRLTVGRQAISWATMLLLTPTDPFAPFDPSDPFREYRAGVDAVRGTIFAGPFTELDAVIRPAQFAGSTTITALGRARTTHASWDVSAWGGVLHDHAAAALGVARSVGGWGVRAAAALRHGPTGGAALRAAAGVQRRLTFIGRDLYVNVEYQHDGLGAATGSDLIAVATSAPFRRGELQVLGRQVAAGEATYQLHPLLAVQLLALWDAGDGSVLLAPAASLSASDEVTLRAGLFLGAGPSGLTLLGAPASEFGALPRVGYVSLAAFF